MHHSKLWLLLPLYVILSFSTPAPAMRFGLPRLGILEERLLEREGAAATPSASLSPDFETYLYYQTLDHFNYRPESYATFQQRYVINSKYWGGPDAPIFAYLGAEAPLDGDLAVVGFLTDNALRFKALLVYIEHRFYGKSVPFGSFEQALHNASLRGYFNSAQAIADYAEVLTYLKQKLQAQNSPIIVIGGSYGGMLASWFRLKYPHIAIGALASSAPILYFDDITAEDGYPSIVTKDFKEVSQSCYETIQNSWAEIDRVASATDGLATLSKMFRTCGLLNKSGELKDYLETIYDIAAQYNHPPKYPVTIVCQGIDGAPEGSNTLDRIFAGLVAFRGNRTCFNVNEYNTPSETNEGWRWQTCSEMVMPIGRGNNDTMFPAAPFNMTDFSETCMSLYNVMPRPHWITTYYGGHDIKLILSNFASNIIFSNGLRDPYSSAGVLQNVSDSIIAVSTVNGSHCLDIHRRNETDPEWLVMQRNKEIEIIEGWILQYYSEL